MAFFTPDAPVCFEPLHDTDHYHFGILGILSHDGRSKFRRAIRETWLSPAIRPKSIEARFVLRGIGTAASTEAEAHTHTD